MKNVKDKRYKVGKAVTTSEMSRGLNSEQELFQVIKKKPLS